jgi:hypothetical protein
MKIHGLMIRVTLAIATTLSLQSVTHASTKWDDITKQAGQKIAQLQPVQSQSQTEDISLNQPGETFFSHSPQLTRAAVASIGAYTPSTYEFTLTVPQDAGQPLKAVKIAQSESPETVRFDISNSKAFLGQRLTASSEIRLASVGDEQPTNPGEATIVFDQPVQPGSTVTIALAVRRNPIWSGVYLFGVTAYPTGENGMGQFLGYGRINFYGNSD